MGAGAGKRAAEVHWSVAQRMAFAWLLTLPAAAAMAALLYAGTEVFGTDLAGPIVVSALAGLASATLFFQARRSPVTAEDV